MLYDYQYTVIAVLVTVVLMILVYQRKSYSSKSNRVFMSLLYANLLAAATDVFTFWTISYPERYPTWVLYASNIIYLWLFGTVAATFLRYITTLVGEIRVEKAGIMQYLFMVITEGVLLLTTPWTHWIFYYDDQLTYRHGSLFVIMYILPIALITNGILFLLKRKRQFSNFQRLTAGTMFVIAIIVAVIQMSIPKADMFHMMSVLILLSVYVVFENPAYYTYHATRCFNAKAFYEEGLRLKTLNKDAEMLLVGVANRPRSHGVQEGMVITRLMDTVAERLRKHFGRSVYCLSDGKFVIIMGRNKKDFSGARAKIAELFSDPVLVGDEYIQVEILTRSFRFKDTEIAEDFVDHLIEGIQQTSVERLFTVPDISSLFLSQHEYREVEDAIANAINHNRFYMLYQPIFDVKAGTFHSAEALLRMHDPDLGEVRPDVFINIAERNGSILRIGEMVMEMVCEFINSDVFRDSSLEFVEVNVSPQQLLHKGCGEKLVEILKAHGIPASKLNLEITESSLDFSEPSVLHNIQVMESYGLTFSIDDYGTGFASADYLYKLPITIVKIDRTILLQAMKNPSAMLVFKTTIDMVKRLEKKVVVEGAEDAEMVETIAGAGGDYIQGYYYARPMSKEALEKFLIHE